MLDKLHIIGFTHQNSSLELVGKFHIDPNHRAEKLAVLKKQLKLSELLYLSTCNRVEFIMVSEAGLNDNFINVLASISEQEISNAALNQASIEVIVLEGETALDHCFRVAASLDSLVVGEREIITQFRKAYEECYELGLTGDFLRLLSKATIETAKRIFTETPVSRNPVSVVSLAYRQLLALHVKKDARIIVVGAGQTNVNLCKFLNKHGYTNFTVYNRSLINGQQLANMVQGTAHALEVLFQRTEGFDVLITCTSSADHLINTDQYSKLLCGETSRKIIIDLAVPADVDPAVYDAFPTVAISMISLKEIAAKNIDLRKSALSQCEKILTEQKSIFNHTCKHRKIELAMQDIPKKVREIRAHATETVFARELSQLDPQSRELVLNMMQYMEKKYISVPMKMAKEILLEQA
jgi:glutamyl-tRNA reductase